MIGEEVVISGGEALASDSKERILEIAGVEAIGKEWQEALHKITSLGRGLDDTDSKEVKRYLECINIHARTAREMVSLKKGIGAGDGEGFLKALGIEE